MKRAWFGLTGIAALLAAAAPAWAWDSISVPGNIFTNAQWTPSTRYLTSHSGSVWSGDVAVDQQGDFKFAADGNWTTSWGGIGVSPVILRLPATGVGPLTSADGKNIALKAIDAPKTLHFSFDDTNQTFSVTGSAAPSVTSAQLVGIFNDYGASTAGTLANSSGSLWTADIPLTSGASLALRVNGEEQAWGTPFPVSPDLPATLPLCGDNSFSLPNFRPGTFRATFDAAALTLKLEQIATNTFVRAGIAAEGPLNALWASRKDIPSPQDINLAPDGSLYTGSFWIDATTNFTLSFSERDANGNRGGLYWSAPSAASVSISSTPHTNTWIAVTDARSVVSNTFTAPAAGLYEISLNPSSGALSVRRRYGANDNVNLFKDPSFEKDGTWNRFNAIRYDARGEEEPPSIHTGHGVAALLQRQFEDGDYGSVSQWINLSTNYAGSSLHVSAWLCAVNNWTASRTRIWIQWQDASGNPVGAEKETVLSDIPSTWTPFSVEAEIPDGAVKANVLFAYNGANDGWGYLLVDDAEARISSSRRLDFNTWTQISSSFGSHSPDWSISRGRTTNNLSDAHLDPGALFISKYIEGSNNNKAIELFNPTTSPINLSGWELQQYNNGSPTASVSFALSGTIATGACFLITRTFDDPVPLSDTLKTASDKQFYGLTFNGDDAIVLVDPSGNVADRVGQVRSDITGSLLAYVMRDHTLVRSPYTARGTTPAITNDFPYSEWEILPCDDFTDLKTHTRSLPPDLYIPSGLSLVLATNAILTSPRLDGGIGDVSFWYRTAFAESAGIAATNSATLVVEASDTENFASVTTLGTVVVPADQYDFKQFSVLADLSSMLYFRIRSTDVTGIAPYFAYARIDDLYVGETLPISRYQDFNVWTNASWAAYDGKYSLGGWTLANGRTTLEGGISGTAAAILPNGASVVSPTLDTGAGLVYFWTSAADPDDDSYAIAVEKSTDGGVKWSQIASFTGSGASNWVSRNLSASVAADVAIRFVSTGTGPVLVDNIRIELPEAASRNQDFNSWPVSSGYTSDSYQGWVSSSAMIAADSGIDGTRGFRAKAANASILSPALDGGLGIVSFVARPYSSSHSPAFKVEVSRDDGNTWKTVFTNRLDGASSLEWTSFEVAVNDETVTHVRIVNTMAQTICIDSIVCGKIVPPPSMNIIPGLDPAVPYPDETFRFASFVNPVGGASRSDIVSVTAGYTLVPAGKKPETGSVELDFDAASGAYYSSNFPGLADGSRIVFSNVVAWTSNGTQIATASDRTTVYVDSLANSGVWINEIFTICHTELDGAFGLFPQDHEFVEICGPAGTDLSNWSLEFLLATNRSSSSNSFSYTSYATYRFTTNNTSPASALTLGADAVTSIVTNDLGVTTNGYGFFVVGDANFDWHVNVVLDQLSPFSTVNEYGMVMEMNDHIADINVSGGVIILRNPKGQTVDSVSYSISAGASVTAVGPADDTWDTTNSISATGGPGYSGTQFAWTNSIGNSAGAANAGQTFTNHASSSKNIPYAFHVPSLHIVPDKPEFDAFDMLDPWPPTIANPVFFYLGYPDSYPEGTCIVHTRPLGDGGYDDHDAELQLGANSGTNSFMRWRMDDPYTTGWERLSSIQYYFSFNPNPSDYTTVYVGAGENGDSRVYESEQVAADHPFTYTFIFHDDIEFVSLADFKATLKDAGREGEYPYADTVSFPADPEAPSKLVFFDPDVTWPPKPTELSLEFLPGSLLDAAAWRKLSDVGIDSLDVDNVSPAVNGRYFFLEFFPTSSPTFYRVAPKTQPAPADLALD